jgi:hypothetical protein
MRTTDFDDEPLVETIRRKSINSFHRADIFCRKSDRNARLVLKKVQLKQAKKTFGLDYMTLLEKEESSPDELDSCMRAGYEKIGVLHKDMKTLRAEKKSLDELLRQKLLRNKQEEEHEEQEKEPSIHVTTEATDRKHSPRRPTKAAAAEDSWNDFAHPPPSTLKDPPPPAAEETFMTSDTFFVLPPMTGTDDEDSAAWSDPRNID